MTTSTELLMMLIDAGMKGALVLALTCTAAGLLHRASAGARHTVWFLGVAGVLVLPLLTAALPSWHALPTWTTTDKVQQVTTHVTAPAIPTIALPPVQPQSMESIFPSTAETIGASSAAPTPLPPVVIDWRAVVLVVWLAGALVAIAPVVIGRWSLMRVSRKSAPVTDGSWMSLLTRCREELGVRRDVRLLRSDRRAMPMTWTSGLPGARRAVILIPAEADDWPAERRRVVLLHELAHIQRRDCLTQRLTQLACALHWFNPLVWLASKRMQIERELACDDLVLAAGAHPSDYAEHLLRIASGLRSHLFAPYSAIAMARKSKLEGRLLAILDATRNRRAMTAGVTVLAALIGGTCLLPIAILHAQSNDETETMQEEHADESPGERQRHFVRLVTGPDQMTFEGEPVTLEQLPKRLERVTDRADTVLQIAVSTPDVTVGRLKQVEALASNQVERLGFEHLSYTGIHPLGAKGDPSESRPFTHDLLFPEPKRVLLKQDETAISDAELSALLASRKWQRMEREQERMERHRKLGEAIQWSTDEDVEQAIAEAIGQINAAMEQVNAAIERDDLPITTELTHQLQEAVASLETALADTQIDYRLQTVLKQVLAKQERLNQPGLDRSIVVSDELEGLRPEDLAHLQTLAAVDAVLTVKTITLSHTDGTAEGKCSLGGSAHAVTFDKPPELGPVTAVEIFAGRYGHPIPPDEDFHVYLLDEDQRVILLHLVPYKTIERGDLRWYTLELPATEVPDRFFVALDFNPHRTKGVYLGFDTDVEQTHSYTRLPEGGFTPFEEPQDWMVRVQLAAEQESDED